MEALLREEVFLAHLTSSLYKPAQQSVLRNRPFISASDAILRGAFFEKWLRAPLQNPELAKNLAES